MATNALSCRARRYPRADEPALGEVLTLWALYGYEATAIYVTYGRGLPVDERPTGARDPWRGATQALIFVRHPVFPASIASVPIALTRLPRSGVVPAIKAGSAGAGIAAAALTVASRRGRLRAARGEILAASGVAFALGLTATSAKLAGVGSVGRRDEGDRLRLASAACLLATAAPWILADLGIYAADVPLVGAPFLSRERLPPGSTQPAVHLGHHHGMDGVLLALTALALSRSLGSVHPAPVRNGLSLYLAGLLVYGIARAAEDAWNEQIVKRGWTSLKLPLIIRDRRPVGRRTWGAMLLAAVAVHRLWIGRGTT